MKTVKNYDNFSDEYRLNENMIGKAWGKVLTFFRTKFRDSAWFYYVLFLKKTGQLPKKQIEIIVPDSYGDQSDVPTEVEVKEFTNETVQIQRGLQLNEERIELPSTTLTNVDMEGLVDEILTVYKMNLNRVEKGRKRDMNDALYIWGAPGIGKTSVLHAVAEKLGVMVMTWHLSQIEPTDFRGVPKIENIVPGSTNPEDERTVTKLPGVFPTNNGPNGKGGIMFFDEINRAPKMVLSAALSLCLEGKIQSYELPSKWIVIAAGNRPEDLGGAVATTIEPALANRFAHVNYAPTVEQWIAWAITQEQINPDIVAFLTWNKDYFHKLDPDVEKMDWPSPRSWELASRKDWFLRGEDWKANLPYTKIKSTYAPYIGAEAALAFIEYLKLKETYNEKDIEDVYKKGKAAKKPPTRLDQQRAAAASISFWKKGKNLTVQELTNVLEFAIDLPSKEQQTTLLAFMKMVHPEIRVDEPWKKIYWEYVKKWHIQEDETGLSIGKK
jgi:hypothetical protein